MGDRVAPLVSRDLGGAVIGLLFLAIFVFLAVMWHVGWGGTASVALVLLTAALAFALIYTGTRRR